MPSMGGSRPRELVTAGDEVGGVDESEAIWLELPSLSRGDMSPTPIGVILSRIDRL